MNKGAFSHEEEILLFDGLSYGVMSVQDTEYKQYKVKEDTNYTASGDPLFIKKGTLVQITNDKPDEDGDIKIKLIEGEASTRKLFFKLD